MKIKKSVFKGLIKECLVEILQEGLGDMLSAPLAKNLSPFGGGAEEEENDGLLAGEEEPEEVDADAMEEEPAEEEEEDAGGFPNFGGDDADDEEAEEEAEEEDEPVQEVRRPSRKPVLKENAKRKPAPAKRPTQKTVADRRNDRLDHLTRQVASSIKGSGQTKSLFENIFRDTAQTTLQEQQERSPMSAAVRDYGKHNVIAANPEEIFEGADRWAQLAYERPKTYVGKR